MDGGRTRESADNEQSVDLNHLVRGVRRRWRWVVWPTVAALLASSAFVFTVSPRYTGVAKVLLEDQESYYTRPDKASGFDPAATIDDEAVQSQAEAAATTDVGRKAVEKLGLATTAEFNPDHVANDDRRVVDRFMSRLTVFPVPRSRVLQIEFVSRDPGLAARGANTVAQLFLQSQTEAKAKAAGAASEWLSGKIEDLRGKVAAADAKVEAFRAQSGLLAGANGQTVFSQQLSDLSAQLANARSAEAAATAKADLLRKLEQEGRLDEAPSSITDESMRRFVEQRVALKDQIAEAGRTLLPLHPHMKELSAQLAGLDAQIRDSAARNVRAFENDARLSHNQVSTLSAALAQQSRTVATGNEDDVRLRALEMDAKAARDQLESYLQKYREAAARDVADAAPADARIIANAEPPRLPTFPKIWPTILLATLSTFVVSTGVAAAASLISDDASSGPDPAPQSRTMTPLAEAASQAAQPTPNPPAAVDLALPNPQAAAVAPIDLRRSGRVLADRLTRLRASDGVLVVLIAGDGSARALPIALETARRLSARESTLLVDLGAAQDWFADIVDREDAGAVEIPGLADLLAGRAAFGEVIRRDLSSGLDVVSAGGEVHGDNLADVLAAFVSAYVCVILHASDWRAARARSAAALAGAIVVVAPAQRTRRAVEQARAALGEARAEIFGFPEAPAEPAMEEAT